MAALGNAGQPVLYYYPGRALARSMTREGPATLSRTEFVAAEPWLNQRPMFCHAAVRRDVCDKPYVQVFDPAIRDANLTPYRVDNDPSASIPIETIEQEIGNSVTCFARSPKTIQMSGLS